ncbi:MAG: chitobiase/beta-hexosaminidase C-terminal domain-containing protein [Oscillospiraceae bacterium]|jgi:uncharacterized protein YgiM (DUF1202 family)|nr:chitobiase/beta-hexosaminidase C-terminal domain-containing protein [Oscillospiraceae bacterium]
MNASRRYILLLILLLAAALALPAVASAAPGEDYGNSDLNILNGGVMLSDGEDFYFNQDGIFVQRGDAVEALSADDGVNLNLSGGYLYYTVGRYICRIPADGGSRELVLTAAQPIKQLYVKGESLLYISDGWVFEAKAFGVATGIDAPAKVMGLIPTEFGNLYLTGQPLNYTLWAGKTAILENVQSCYTDSGYLAIQIGNKNYQAPLSGLFDGFSEAQLEPFNIHGTSSIAEVLSPDDQNAISEYNDNNELMLDFEALLLDSGFDLESRLVAGTSSSSDGEDEQSVIPTVSQGQLNMVLRARQLHEIEWTPLENRTQWRSRGVFQAGVTYTGLPYGQPVNTNGYVGGTINTQTGAKELRAGFGLTLEDYSKAILDNTSRFYTTYSEYTAIAPSFSTDCSGYVSYAWGINRSTTYSLPFVAERVGDQSLYSLQVGDALDKTVSHVAMISDLKYDAEGNIIGLTVMEQTPVITKLTSYGAGESRSLASFQTYYFDGGYEIYRNPNRDSVQYNPSAAVPLDGEPRTFDRAPKAAVTGIIGGKTVSLSADDPNAVIYYTLNGSEPTTGSTRYSGPITVYDETRLQAIAYTGKYADSAVLRYTIKVPQLAAPSFSVDYGLYSGNYVAADSKIAISSASGAKIYYTTNGAAPTIGGTLYSSPLTMKGDMTIKAIAEAPGYKTSAVSSVDYKLGRVYSITASSGAGGSISPTGTALVVQTGSETYIITPAAGFKVADVLVDGSSVGAVTSYTFSNINSNHTISASFKSSGTLPFTDVASDAWYYESVSYVYASGLFNGTSSTTFSPQTAMNRAMFITVLGRAAGISEEFKGSAIGLVTATDVNIRSSPSTSSEIVGSVKNRLSVVQVLGKSGDWYNIKFGSVTGYIRNDLMRAYNGNFSDLPLDQYYSVYAQWAYLSGITEGTAAGSFRPQELITREDMCLLLYSYMRVYNKSLPDNIEISAFSDEWQMDSDSVSAIYALGRAGIINGMGNGTFVPKGSAKRSEVAQIFRKFANI